MTIEKDPQVCVDEHFQHEIASRDPALVCSGEKSQRHLAHWDQDHHDQSLVGDTFRWEDVDRISRSFHLLDILSPCWCPLPSWSSWWLWEGKACPFPAPASVRGCWGGFGENPASGSELKKRRWEEAARSKLKHLSSLPSLTQSTRGKGTSGTFGEEMKRLLLNSGCFSRCSRQRHCLGWFCPGNRLNPLIFQ